MNTLDILFLIPLLWFAYKGFVNGLAVELASLLALLLGIYLSYRFSIFVGDKIGLNGKYAGILAFIITFIAVVVLVHLSAKLIDKAFSLVSLGFVNKIAGIIFGILKIALIISIILYLINILDAKKIIISEKNRNESVLFRPIEKLAPMIFTGLKNETETAKSKK
ncbi:MAG: CvpA family protein [Bacteroidales bacterium]